MDVHLKLIYIWPPQPPKDPHLRATNELISVITRAKATGSNHLISLNLHRCSHWQSSKELNQLKAENRTKLPLDCIQPRLADGLEVTICFFSFSKVWKRSPHLRWSRSASIISAFALCRGPGGRGQPFDTPFRQKLLLLLLLMLLTGALLSAAFHAVSATIWMGAWIGMNDGSFQQQRYPLEWVKKEHILYI